MLTVRIRRRHHARHGKDTEPVPPQRFWDLLRHDQKARDGRLLDLRFEDMYDSLRREYRRWLVESRIG